MASRIFDTLSDAQRRVVFEKEGMFAVRACPGSGKTYSVAARLAHKIETWKLRNQGIASISFTNAAWQEIEKQVTSHFRIQKPIPYPHFLGTIDSFINRFIFLPFGHLVMGCTSRPILVGEPHGTWTGRSFSESFFDNLSYDVKGNLCPLNKSIMPPRWETNKYIRMAKSRLIRAGYANQDDSNYFGMKILETYPGISKALVSRFPMLMMDEAQDTSEIQMRIIDNLIENGLNEVLLVGDPDQAIFEWHDAKPKLFIKKFEQWAENSIVLNENRRSSQKICNCTCRLSSLDKPSIAINCDVKDCDVTPMVVTYDIEKIHKTIDDFLGYCRKMEIDINPKDVAVVFRSRSIFNIITGVKNISSKELPWEDDNLCCRDLAKGKYLCDRGEFRRGHKLIEKAIYKITNNTNYCSDWDIEKMIEEVGFIEFREYVYELISMFGKTECCIGEWVEDANNNLAQRGIGLKLSIKKKCGTSNFDEIFGLDNKHVFEKDFTLGTVHSIKGKTFEAVLMVLKKKGIGSYYRTLLANNARIEENEELRNVYVGITRPRRLLVLAVPDDDDKTAWESQLFR